MRAKVALFPPINVDIKIYYDTYTLDRLQGRPMAVPVSDGLYYDSSVKRGTVLIKGTYLIPLLSLTVVGYSTVDEK